MIDRTELTDAQIDEIFNAMPGGVDGWLKSWGYRQFAQELLALRAMPTWEPAFDIMVPGQEELVMQFCAEIAGPKGKPGRPPDPVRLLEMADALYQTERMDAATSAFQAAEAAQVFCTWFSDSDYGGWRSTCGTAYVFESGGPIENGHKFCHCCGKPLTVSDAKDPNDNT